MVTLYYGNTLCGEQSAGVTLHRLHTLVCPFLTVYNNGTPSCLGSLMAVIASAWVHLWQLLHPPGEVMGRVIGCLFEELESHRSTIMHPLLSFRICLGLETF